MTFNNIKIINIINTDIYNNNINIFLLFKPGNNLVLIGGYGG